MCDVLCTDNFVKMFLLQAFLCDNDFDIVILGDTHLSSKIYSDEFDIEGYSCHRCDYPGDTSRGDNGGIAVTETLRLKPTQRIILMIL